MLLACASSYPLIWHLGSHIPGDGAGDNIGFVWSFWWFRFVHSSSGMHVFDCPYLFAPFGTSLVLHTHTALQSTLGATLLGRLPTVAAHNVVLLAGLTANGVAAYALSLYHVRRVAPAVLAGVVFACSTYIAVHLLGHFNLVHAWVLPVSTLAWIAFVARPSVAGAVGVALSLSAAAYSDYYYFVYALMFALAWTATTAYSLSLRLGPPRSRAVDRTLVAMMTATVLLIVAIAVTGGFSLTFWGISVQHVRNPVSALWLLAIVRLALRCRVEVRRAPESEFPDFKRMAIPLAIAVGLVLVSLWPLATAAAELFRKGDYVSQVYWWHSAPPGLDLITVATGNPMNPLCGWLSRGVLDYFRVDYIEQTAWIGLGPILVGALALRSRAPADAIARRWLFIGGLFLIWAAGPFLVVAGKGTGVLLPQLFARYVPLLANARIPGRAFVMVVLATSVLCAWVVSRGRWSRTTIAVLIAVALADGLAAPFPLYKLPEAGRIERHISSDPNAGAVLELPVGLLDGMGDAGWFDSRALVAQMTHERPLAGGYVSRIAPRIKAGYEDKPAISSLLKLSRRLATGDGGRSVALPHDLAQALRSDGVSYVIVNTDRITLTQQELESRGLRFLMAEGTRDLYRVGEN